MAPGQCMGCLDGAEYQGGPVFHTCGKPDVKERWMVPDRSPPDFYSTLDGDSYNAQLGRWGEGATITKLEKFCDRYTMLESTTTTEERSRLAAINNSQLGDIRVKHWTGNEWVTKHTIEVKVSGDHDNATISVAEFEDSRATYLVAITLAGMWATTMDEVRHCAKPFVRDGKTLFYIVPHRGVQKLPLNQVVK